MKKTKIESKTSNLVFFIQEKDEESKEKTYRFKHDFS